jgi:hypothetical protein
MSGKQRSGQAWAHPWWSGDAQLSGFGVLEGQGEGRKEGGDDAKNYRGDADDVFRRSFFLPELPRFCVELRKLSTLNRFGTIELSRQN